ncbi:tape measure protein [Roseibium sediminis]|uniref:tape measure protein n=1 Tax=Roseibium sediminis TaxID=1775174 RepID=UPI00123DBAD5|nr:tape measure protein [Roseibium sediminis]
MSREVELIIKAREAASSAVKAVTKALEGLTDAQQEVSASATKTDTQLGRLGNQLTELQRKAVALSAFQKIAVDIDKSSRSISRFEADLKGSATELANLARQLQTTQQNLNRLRGVQSAEKTVLEEVTAARKSARAELSAVNKELRKAEARQKSYNNATSKVPDHFLSPAVRSAKAFIDADVNSQRSASDKLAKTVAENTSQIEKSREAIKTLSPAISAAAGEERRLSTQLDRTTSSLKTQKDNLHLSRAALQEMKASAAGVGAALGGLSADQEKIASTAQRAAAQIEAVNARIAALSGARRGPEINTGGVDEQRRRMLELRREWVASQSEVKRLAQDMRNAAAPTNELGTAFGTAQAKARQLKSAYEAQRQSLHELSASARQAAVSVQNTGIAATRAGQAQTSFAMQSRSALSFTQRLRAELLGLTTAYIGLHSAIYSLGQVVSSFQVLEAAQNRLGAVFNQDTAAVANELSFLDRQAERLGISFQVLSDEYAKFAVAADAANFSGAATRRVFLSVAEAGRVNKLTLEQMNGVFLALQQMISKGRVSSEELRRQMGDRLPGAFQIFAAAIGKTEAELDKMLRAGQVAADQETLLRFADELDRRFGDQLQTSLSSTTTELGRFVNSLYQARLRVAEGGFIDALTEAVRRLNEYLSSREGRDFFLALGAALGSVTSAAASLIPYIGELSTVLQIIAAVKLASVLTRWTGGFGQFGASLSNSARQLYQWDTVAKGKIRTVALLRSSYISLSTSLRFLGTSWIAATNYTRMFGVQAAITSGLTRTLQIAVVGLAGTVKLLWLALGGLPGVILTGVTLAIGHWATRVEDVTQAVDEHKRIMGEVISAYDRVAGSAQHWADNIENVSLFDLEDNFREQQKLVERAAQALQQKVASALLSRSGDRAPFQQIAQEFVAGTISVEEFAQRVKELNQTLTEDGPKKFASTLYDLSQALIEDRRRLEEAAIAAHEKGSQLEGVSDIARSTGKTIEDLASATKKAGSAFAEEQEALQKFNGALAEIDKLVPQVSDELERLGEIDALNKLYHDGLKAARSMGQVLQLTQKYNSALKDIAGNIGSSDTLIDKIVGAESSGDPTARNSRSSATGLGQFISSTWLGLFKEKFPSVAADMTDAAILELRNDPKISRQMTALYAQQNAQILSNAGIAATDTNLYLAHFLGPQGAINVAGASANTPVSELLGADQIAANPTVLGNGATAGDVSEFAARKMGISSEELAIQNEIYSTETKRAEKALEYTEDLERRLRYSEIEAQNNGRLTREAHIQQAVEQEIAKAKESHKTLDEEQLERIRNIAAAEYDRQAATKGTKSEIQEANTALQQANALARQRTTLEQEYRAATASGDSTAAADLQIELEQVNQKLQQAIANARSMWEAIGGDKADVALTKLDTLAAKTTKAGGGIQVFGLTAQKTGQLAGSFVDGFIGVFDNFANAIANGQNAWVALGRAFLQFAADFLRQMGTMILRQIMFNALSKIGFGGGGIGLAHSGGLIGAGSAGVGNATKNVSPALFANAARYHTGGVVGLGPDEVPLIAKQNEEMITEQDPRHRNNGGLSGGKGNDAQPMTIRNIVTMDPQFASDMIKSATGEQAVLSVMSRNKSMLKRMVGE